MRLQTRLAIFRVVAAIPLLAWLAYPEAGFWACVFIFANYALIEYGLRQIQRDRAARSLLIDGMLRMTVKVRELSDVVLDEAWNRSPPAAGPERRCHILSCKHREDQHREDGRCFAPNRETSRGVCECPGWTYIVDAEWEDGDTAPSVESGQIQEEVDDLLRGRKARLTQADPECANLICLHPKSQHKAGDMAVRKDGCRVNIAEPPDMLAYCPCRSFEE